MKKIEYVKKINREITSWIDKCNTFFESNNFLDYIDVDNFLKINLFPPKKKLGLTFDLNVLLKYFDYIKLYKIACQIPNNMKSKVDEHNNKLSLERIEHFKKICDKIENKELDSQQIDSIIRENRNQLVIAGAGSGKTTTIIGKVKYILNNNLAKSNEILLLSFTTASANEMKKRVENETNTKIETYTFHKLGLEIIKKSTNKAVNVYDKNLQKFILDKMKIFIGNKIYLNNLIKFVIYDFNEIKAESEFTNLEEYDKFLSQNPPTTLKKENVKSYGELEISNYLYINGIDYVYEEPYVFDTFTMDHQQYKPDFHILNTNCYIEYFGIDENGNVAPHFVSRNDKSPTENYQESMKWKKDLHKSNSTFLIESFYYEYKNGNLLNILENNLKKNNIKLNPKSDEHLWKEINEKNACILDEISNIFSSIINLIKSNNITFMEFRKMCLKRNIKNNVLILELLEPIYNSYNEYLKINSLIDFNDMINIANECVLNNLYKHNYKYIIVDEYQDISMSRFNLLKSLRNQKDYSLFCVGDDWQSIYRFSGSDVGLILNFEKYWGDTYISRIERTYRFSDTMASISGNFVMQNPCQIKKQIIGIKDKCNPIGCIYLKNEFDLNYKLVKKLESLPVNSSVFFIGRYKFDIDLLDDRFRKQYNNISQMTEVIFEARKDLKINFLTAHKSKGLQADYVFVLNNKDFGMGFPSKIADLSIVKVLLDNTDDFVFGEERRLFYVVMTRSRKKTIFMVLNNNKSCFIKELERNYKAELNREFYECPKCGAQLRKKNGSYGEFFGCENYPICKYTKNMK